MIDVGDHPDHRRIFNRVVHMFFGVGSILDAD